MKFSILPAVLAVSALTAALPAMADSEGRFVGASNHVTTGGVRIVEASDGSMSVVLGDDFSLDGGPDPRVVLGRDGAPDEAADLGPLGALTGGQTYPVPASVDVSGVDQVYIWCGEFAVPLGVASLR